MIPKTSENTPKPQVFRPISLLNEDLNQLSAFVQALPKPLRDITSLTPIETVFADDQPIVKPLSYFYQALITLSTASYPSFLHSWEKDLHKILSETQRDSILHLSHSSSMSSKAAEVNYKLLTRWHYTPMLLHKLFPQTSPLCWRGCGIACSCLVVLSTYKALLAHYPLLD